jgi:hypothetical protein
MQTRWIPVIALGACCVVLSATAAADDWTPSAAPPMPAGAPGIATPGQPPVTAPMPPQLPMRPGMPQGRYAAGGTAAPEYDPETGRIAFDFAGLRVIQSRADDAYLLDIELRGLPAEQVQIRPAGGGLMLVVRRTAESTREETLGDGYGYRRSWGYSSGQSVKRLPAPPDADVRAMQREDAADAIRVSIPRRADVPTYQPEQLYQPPAPGTMPGRQP